MRTADLTGALLDYWTARAEGIPAAELELRAVGTLCVRNLRGNWGPTVVVQVLDYSTSWALSGPLVEKHQVECRVYAPDNWAASLPAVAPFKRCTGNTALIAICRAVVRAAFGDEVEDLPC